MILFSCLCVSVLFIGLALDGRARAALADLWLHLFGVRVRAPSRPQAERPMASQPVAPPSRYDFLPPPRVTTHMVPRQGP